MDTLIIVFLFGAFLGWRAAAFWYQRVFTQILQDLGVPNSRLQKLHDEISTEEADDDEADTIEILVEKHGDQLYVYRKDSGEFLAQGQDKDTVVNRIAERFSNVRFRIAEEDGAHYFK